MAKELLACEKERAEHIMLVDLGRNDVGRVATPGTVVVDSLMKIEKYSHVMHIVSQVSGELAKDKDMFDAFRSIFPAGTVSGAPKIRAMQLVAGMEGERRGVYAGAVGYVSYSEVLDVAIAIRTLVVKDGVAYLQAGGGIVYDSEETPEYKETMNKMRALAVAITRAEERAKRLNNSAKVVSGKKRKTMTESNSTDVIPASLLEAMTSLKQAFTLASKDTEFQAGLNHEQKAFTSKLETLLQDL